MATTADDLKAEFKTRFPTLEVVCERFLGLRDKYGIYKKYAAGEIPFSAFKAIKSQSAPLLVDVNDLAIYIDSQSKLARESR